MRHILTSRIPSKILWVNNPEYSERVFDAGIPYPKLHHWWPDACERFGSFE